MHSGQNVVNIFKYFLHNCLQVETMIRNLKDAIWEKDAPHKVTSFLWMENILFAFQKIFAGSEHAADQPAPAAQHRAVPRRAGAQADRGGDRAGDHRAAAGEQGGGR